MAKSITNAVKIISKLQKHFRCRVVKQGCQVVQNYSSVYFLLLVMMRTV